VTLLATLAAVVVLLFQNAAVATFDGEFKSADKKYVTVEVEDGQTMRMFITRGTKFIRDGKPARPADFHQGDKVSVDAERDARMNMLAVRVEAPPDGKKAK
jgi:hypothetical protein